VPTPLQDIPMNQRHPHPLAAQHRFCVAPMMDWTDRHDRRFLRCLSNEAMLYSEMVTSAALVHGDSVALLAHSPEEYPVALQIGGSDPEQLQRAAKMGAAAGYCEINLNVGCPSERVQSGAFGACLMAEPELVARCVSAMREVVDVPVTVKCRIGIDDQDSEAALQHFVGTVADAGCELFIVHARKAILSGLSPKQNRDIPPLDYDRVYRLKQHFSHLAIIINGGIVDLETAHAQLEHVDGVMLGREAYQNPFLLAHVDSRFYGATPSQTTRDSVLRAYLPYVEQQLAAGTPLQHITRHLLGLYKGVHGGKQFRRHLSENAYRPEAGIEVLVDAMALASENYRRLAHADDD
jgi:tRNA-dihydrouridine synthase A